MTNENGKTYGPEGLGQDCSAITLNEMSITGTEGGAGQFSLCYMVEKEFNNFKVYYGYYDAHDGQHDGQQQTAPVARIRDRQQVTQTVDQHEDHDRRDDQHPGRHAVGRPARLVLRREETVGRPGASRSRLRL